MRNLEIQCDNCGRDKRASGERPATWWELHPVGAQHTVGALDFCSLPCLQNWADAPEVRTHAAYALDFSQVGKG